MTPILPGPGAFSEASSIKKVMKRIRNQVKEPWHRYITSLSSEESGQHVHWKTLRLGMKSGKNDTCDFWKMVDCGVELWLQPHIASLCARFRPRKSKVSGYHARTPSWDSRSKSSPFFTRIGCCGFSSTRLEFPLLLKMWLLTGSTSGT